MFLYLYDQKSYLLKKKIFFHKVGGGGGLYGFFLKQNAFYKFFFAEFLKNKILIQ